ncbi:MAG: hypothetical protein E7012_05445 [Alphaproteobacteria bacterium]|nr:hypothetical protein [Alphaproteobacteria bacterium]
MIAKKYIFMLSLLISLSIKNCLANESDVSVDTNEEERPIALTEEEILKMKAKLNDKIKKAAAESDERNRRRLAETVETLKKHMILRANLKLPEDQQLTYSDSNINYKDTDRFGKELNDFFETELVTLTSIKEQPSQTENTLQPQKQPSVETPESTVSNVDTIPTFQKEAPKINTENRSPSGRKKFTR